VVRWAAVRSRVGVVVTAVAAVIVIAATTPSAFAAAVPGWSVEPSGPSGPGARAYFVYELQPGARLQDTVAVTNSSNEPLTFTLYARDAVTPKGGGGLAFQDKSDQPQEAGSWITLPVDRYTLAPGTRADIGFTITVPADATPGDRVAGIIGTVVPDASTTATSSGLRVEQRLAARLYVRVSGDHHPAMSIDQLHIDYGRDPMAPPTAADVTVQYRVGNTGDVRLSPDVVLTLEDGLGRRLARSDPVRLSEVLPGGSASGTYRFRDVLATTRLRVAAVASTLGVSATSAHRSEAIWVVSWPLVVAVLTLMAVLAALVARLRRRQRFS
jgi:hypothetical protein